MTKFTCSVLGVLILVSCNLGFAGVGCKPCPTELSDVEKDIILRCLVGHMRMYPEDLEGAKQAVNCAIEEWNRKDGTIGSMISNAFIAMMETNPVVFFDVMANNEAIFSEWVDQLRGLSFTWHKEPPSPLEARRKNLVEFLSKVGPLKSQGDTLRQRLLSVMRLIRVRQVE